MDYQEVKNRIRDLVSKDDIRGALQVLNELTPHRFTGMYRFEDPAHKNIYIVDKSNPASEQADDIPVTATYCAFTRERRDTVLIPDSLIDESLRDHPARKEVRSYCGVPLLDGRGNVFGTICHYDFDVVDISDVNVQLLEDMAPLLERQPD